MAVWPRPARLKAERPRALVPAQVGRAYARPAGASERGPSMGTHAHGPHSRLVVGDSRQRDGWGHPAVEARAVRAARASPALQNARQNSDRAAVRDGRPPGAALLACTVHPGRRTATPCHEGGDPVRACGWPSRSVPPPAPVRGIADVARTSRKRQCSDKPIPCRAPGMRVSIPTLRRPSSASQHPAEGPAPARRPHRDRRYIRFTTYL